MPAIEPFQAAFGALSSDSDADLLCAFADGQMLGYVLAFHHATFYANGPVTWVEELYVLPAQRRRGVATALMRAVESRAEERGSTLVALATRRAETFYKALGYEDSAVYFRKVLQSHD